MHNYYAHHVHSTVIMEPTSPHMVSVNIGETVKKHLASVPNLFAAHPFIGCDKVGAYFGIGKANAVKVLQTARHQFHTICNTYSDMEEIIKEVTSYIAACYSTTIRPGDVKSDVLYRVWGAKMVRKGVCIQPELQYLPPPSMAFEENVKEPIYRLQSGEQHLTLILLTWNHMTMSG